MKDVQQLAFVFMDPLDVHIKNGVRVDRNAVVLRNVISHSQFVLAADLREGLLYVGLGCAGSQLLQCPKVTNPLWTNLAAD